MSAWRILVNLGIVLAACGSLKSAPFVVFPKAGELRSPDGRFVVRNAEREAPATDLDGTFHSLWVVESGSGRTRKLCDYVGVAAAAWTEDDRLLVTEYLGRRTSRALLFAVADATGPLVLDKGTLTQQVPPALRDTLRGNDHVFIEAEAVAGNELLLEVWGYGKHDAMGFRWKCSYNIPENRIACAAKR